jgi:hypothetical protein
MKFSIMTLKSFFIIRLLSLAVGFSLGSAVASEGTVLIVNGSSPITDMPLAIVEKLLKADLRSTPDGGKCTLILPKDGSKELDVLLDKVYKTDANGFKKFWVNQVFQNIISSIPRSASSRVTVKIITDDPTGIGVVNAKDVLPGVKIINVDGKGPDAPDYFLR